MWMCAYISMDVYDVEVSASYPTTAVDMACFLWRIYDFWYASLTEVIFCL